MIADEQIEELRAQFGRVGVVRFEQHLFVFQQPNDEHARFFRRGVAAANVDTTDQLAAQLIVAMDDSIAADLKSREPLRGQFRTWLKTRPLAMDNAFFSPVLSELLGQTEEGNAVAAGKGCLVLSDTQETSP